MSLAARTADHWALQGSTMPQCIDSHQLEIAWDCWQLQDQDPDRFAVINATDAIEVVSSHIEYALNLLYQGGSEKEKVGE